MKLLVAAFLSFVSLAAFARNEVECSGRSGDSQVVVNIEEGFGGSFRQATVQVRRQDGGEARRYSVLARGAFGNRVRYEGGGFDLEIDFWPDVRPQWGRSYRGDFRSLDLELPFTMLWCRFPYARP